MELFSILSYWQCGVVLTQLHKFQSARIQIFICPGTYTLIQISPLSKVEFHIRPPGFAKKKLCAHTTTCNKEENRFREISQTWRVYAARELRFSLIFLRLH
jgi:hypothetical protein